MLEKRDPGSLKSVLELYVSAAMLKSPLTKGSYRSRSLSARAWDNSPNVLRQLDGVGEKSIKLLSEKGATEQPRSFTPLTERATGIDSLAAIASANPRRLELVCHCRPALPKG